MELLLIFRLGTCFGFHLLLHILVFADPEILHLVDKLFILLCFVSRPHSKDPSRERFNLAFFAKHLLSKIKLTKLAVLSNVNCANSIQITEFLSIRNKI